MQMTTDLKEQVIEKITQEIRNITDKAVIGMSGGADSTLVACLCVKALGKDNVYGVIGIAINNEDFRRFGISWLYKRASG